MPQLPNQDGLNISSNVLFHFTRSIDNLYNILIRYFSPRFCPEYGLFENTSGHPERATAMICFCDLPLFLIKKHLTFYGSYGIGLKKAWGISKGITPVFYVHSKSQSLEPLNFLKSTARNRDDGNETSSDIDSFMYYSKPYEGRAWRDNRKTKKIIFYNEREWRYVPYLENNEPPSLGFQRYRDKQFLEEKTRYLRGLHTLRFAPKDIEYIIVKKDSEILPMAHHIETIRGGKYTPKDKKLLVTKIMSVTRIWEDF